ncbi:DUF4145 domain-containing protein [Nocardioides sp. NPDC127503]|uniref:DUF4145 domain-containing protein n=1 Tax=Nocardioides sp. NPDC127503 TaxID=3154516 RepID=UPI00332F3C10
MSVDPALRTLAQVIESEQPWPRPRCPSCDAGHIRFDQPVDAESHASASSRDHPAFEPEWIRGTFALLGACENPDCRQTVHGTGDYTVDYSKKSAPDNPWEQHGPAYSAYYQLTHLHPPMLLMPIPASAPEVTQEAVRRASRVLFADPGLAATALRAAVERFMSAEGIAATWPSGKFRSAHSRIKEWGEADPNRDRVANLLFAVKWLGNAGTHEDSDLTVSEVLDGAGLLDEAFHRLYTGPDIDARAQNINTAEGPHRPV